MSERELWAAQIGYAERQLQGAYRWIVGFGLALFLTWCGIGYWMWVQSLRR
jgi:hypothetical protein